MISQTTEYALRAVVYLVTHNGSPITRREIADGTLISLEYLARVMQALNAAKIITVHRGPGGGYMMLADKKTLTVYDVITAVEPIPRVERCPLGLKYHQQLCPLHAKLDEAAELVENAFRSTLVIDLLPPTSKNKKRCDFPNAG